MPLKLQWFHNCVPVGTEARIELNASDIYFFSDKAVGYDFKRRSQITLRHAAGKDTCTYARTKRKYGEEHPVTVFVLPSAAPAAIVPKPFPDHSQV